MLCHTDVEVNYMDDVGQTLLNWASAFGTQEMVSGTSVLATLVFIGHWQYTLPSLINPVTSQRKSSVTVTANTYRKNMNKAYIIIYIKLCYLYYVR